MKRDFEPGFAPESRQTIMLQVLPAYLNSAVIPNAAAKAGILTQEISMGTVNYGPFVLGDKPHPKSDQLTFQVTQGDRHNPSRIFIDYQPKVAKVEDLFLRLSPTEELTGHILSLVIFGVSTNPSERLTARPNFIDLSSTPMSEEVFRSLPAARKDEVLKSLDLQATALRLLHEHTTINGEIDEQTVVELKQRIHMLYGTVQGFDTDTMAKLEQAGFGPSHIAVMELRDLFLNQGSIREAIEGLIQRWSEVFTPDNTYTDFFDAYMKKHAPKKNTAKEENI